MLSSKDSLNIGASYLGKANFNNGFSSFSRLGTLSGKTLAMYIKSLFANNEVGFAYDPNDLSTLYQNAAGTIPVTAAGQPVGLVLDKSKGLALGNTLTVQSVELVALSGTAINKGDGTYTASNGGYVRFLYSLANLEQGAWYQVEVEVISSSGNYAIQWCDVFSVQRSGSGVRKALGTRVYDNIYRFADVESTVGSSITFRFLGVKKLSGNHAYQTTSASRPILRRNATTGAYYLEFDGTDDFLVTNSIDFTATDKVTLFAGVRKLSDAASGIVCELSADQNRNNGMFALRAPNAASEGSYAFNSKGTTAISAGVGGFTAPNSAVIAGSSDISKPTLSLRVNGVLKVVQAISQGTGNYGNYPLYIGRRGGTALPFNGHLYGLIGIGRLTTDSETIALEKSIAKNVGVAL